MRVPRPSFPPSAPLSLWERVGVRAPRPSPPPSAPLSLWERVGVRVPRPSFPPSAPLSLWGEGRGEGSQAKLPAVRPPLPLGEGRGEGAQAKLPAVRPSLPLGEGGGEGAQAKLPAVRPPLPLGEGRGEGAQINCPAGYGTEWQGQGCWGALTRPSATLSQRERGWIWGETRPPLSQRERGLFGFMQRWRVRPCDPTGWRFRWSRAAPYRSNPRPGTRWRNGFASRDGASPARGSARTSRVSP